MDSRDLYPLVPAPDRNSMPPSPKEGDGWNLLRSVLREERKIRATEAAASFPSTETQHKDPQNVTAPPLYGKYLEKLESDQDGEQHSVPAFLQLQGPASLQPSEQGMTGATIATNSGGKIISLASERSNTNAY